MFSTLCTECTSQSLVAYTVDVEADQCAFVHDIRHVRYAQAIDDRQRLYNLSIVHLRDDDQIVQLWYEPAVLFYEHLVPRAVHQPGGGQFVRLDPG